MIHLNPNLINNPNKNGMSTPKAWNPKQMNKKDKLQQYTVQLNYISK